MALIITIVFILTITYQNKFCLHLCFSLSNEHSTCYVLSVVQCLSGVRQFIEDAKEEPFSPLLHSYNNIIRAREAGNQEGMISATIELRLLAGETFMAEYLDPKAQQDAYELLTFLLQYMKEQIVQARVEFDIPESDTCIDNNFKMIFEVTKSCPSK